LTREFKITNTTANEFKEGMKDQAKAWASVKGLRSKWFCFDEPSMTMVGLYTFFNRESLMEYMESDLYKSMKTSPMID
jgi:hypothetical protein